MSDKTYRKRNLGLAAALAVLGALLTMVYTSRSGNTAQPAYAEASYVPVLVATKDLQIGTSLQSALRSRSVTLKKLPAGSISPDAVHNPSVLQNTVVVQPIYANEQVTTRRFGSTSAQGVRGVLKGAMRALSIAGDANQLLAGTLQPGDHVDVVVNDRSTRARTRIALSNLIVLSAGGVTGAASSTSTSNQSVTLQLTDRQVQVLWWILKNGDWSLVLRPAAKANVTATAPTGENAVMQGS